MDLKIFFNAIKEETVKYTEGRNCLGKSMLLHHTDFPDLKGINLAIIGIEDERGAATNHGVSLAANKVREKLYALKKGTGTYKIADLGNVRNGVSLEETHLRLKEICQYLIEEKTLPILVGGTHDMMWGQYLAYGEMEKLIAILNVDAFLDMDDRESVSWNRRHLQRLLMHTPNYLFNYVQLAHQTYLIDPEMLAVLEKLYFETYRLGSLRQNLAEMEPIIRQGDMLSFDITAIKSADAPANSNAQPFGLTGEEACQICWYAGLNDKLSSAGFFEFNPRLDEKDKTAKVVATMVWYFIEGFYHRKDTRDFTANDYIKYVVSMPNEPETITFFKSKLSDKWWLEVPYPENDRKTSRWDYSHIRNCIIPCSYADYETANKGELPERWISTHAKLI